MRARVPASSANLGPGFDVLAVALALYIEVNIEPADTLSLHTTGTGAAFNDPTQNPAVALASAILGHDQFALSINSEIPLARGLGSSAALAVAVAAAAGGDPLRAGLEMDGHVENAAASLYGGLVAGSLVAGEPVVTTLPLDERLRFVVAIPEQPLATADARAVLPTSVSLHDAAASIGLTTHLLAGLADIDRLRPAFFDDVLHQPYRAGLLPWSTSLLGSCRDAGAVGSCWSGAGSTMLALCDADHVAAVIAAATDVFTSHGVAGAVRELAADRTGLVVT
jgi:homoserine kinase